MSQFKLKSFSLVLSVLILGGFYSYGLWAWTGPTSAPPGSNASSPVNIGTSDQEKAGRLSATEFYDADDTSFYVNPSGNSMISGTLSLGGDLYDITNSKKVYDSATGKFDPAVMPYEKGDLTSDWATNSDTSVYYTAVDAGNVKSGVSFGRGSSGTLSVSGTAVPIQVKFGKTFYSGDSWTQKSGTFGPSQANGEGAPNTYLVIYHYDASHITLNGKLFAYGSMGCSTPSDEQKKFCYCQGLDFYDAEGSGCYAGTRYDGYRYVYGAGNCTPEGDAHTVNYWWSWVECSKTFTW